MPSIRSTWRAPWSTRSRPPGPGPATWSGARQRSGRRWRSSFPTASATTWSPRPCASPRPRPQLRRRREREPGARLLAADVDVAAFGLELQENAADPVHVPARPLLHPVVSADHQRVRYVHVVDLASADAVGERAEAAPVRCRRPYRQEKGVVEIVLAAPVDPLQNDLFSRHV